MVTEGKDALLTCVIMVPFGNDTVIWRRGHNEILAAGKNRVTSDKRISVLHDDGKYLLKNSSFSKDPHHIRNER